jgi:hypothetical protein
MRPLYSLIGGKITGIQDDGLVTSLRILLPDGSTVYVSGTNDDSFMIEDNP